MAEEKVKTYNYGNVHISLENCILPHEKVETPPSIYDGLDRETEMGLRILGCELIQSGGILLKLPQVAMATGQVLFQRFYYSKSFVKHDFEVVAMACIFLAAKVEESPRRVRDVINVFYHIKQKLNHKTPVPMEYMGNTYFNLKNSVIKAERRVLKELGFCVHVKHPHKIIITYLQILECNNNQALAQRAWNFMNDSLRTDVFVRYKPEVIACACIFLAARQLKIILPTKPAWWELFDADYKEIEDISLTILTLYERSKPDLHKLESKVNAIRKLSQDKKSKDKEGNTSPSKSPANQSQPASRPGSPSKISPLATADGTVTSSKKANVKSDEVKEKKNSSASHEDRRSGHKYPRPKAYNRSRSHSRSRSRSRSHSRSRSRSPHSPKRTRLSPSPKRTRPSPSPKRTRSPHSPNRVPSHSDSESDSDMSNYSDHEKPHSSPAHEQSSDKTSEVSKDFRNKIDNDRKRSKQHEDVLNSYNRTRDRSRSPHVRGHERPKEKHRSKYVIDTDRSKYVIESDFDYHREKRKEEKRRKGERNGEDYREKIKSRDYDKYKR